MAIGGKTKLLGLIGWPVSHSLSPAMHNAAAEALGLDYAYLPLPVHPDKVADAIRGLAALGFRGVNVTIPHKLAVMPLLDEIDPAAEAIGAVNTIVIDTADGSSHLTGYNTDWSGFLADLNGLGIEIAGRDCLVLGAGGSARAIAFGLASSGGRVKILARRAAQAEKLCQLLSPHLPAAELAWHPLSAIGEIAGGSEAPLIINSSPLGMTPHVDTSIWPDDLQFPAGSFVYDLVYNPARTRIMAQAEAAGCGSANGLGMLLHQGVIAFQMWTDRTPDVKVMKAALG